MSDPHRSSRCGIHKRFGDVVANEDVTLDVLPGEVHAILGENGAGKTTLMRILYGLSTADRGTIEVLGRAVSIGSPKDALRHGIGGHGASLWRPDDGHRQRAAHLGGWSVGSPGGRERVLGSSFYSV
jgi:ABC-type phosphonate transport system ATPase subunit